MEKILLSSPHMSKNSIKYMQQAFDTNWVAPAGPHIDLFEEKISSISAGHHVAVLSSGTSAIHLALIILNIQKDDIVLCSSFTFAASANPIIYQGALPVFIDSEQETWNMDPVLLEEAIIDQIKINKKPKAIILVHLYGFPSKMNEILEIANRYKIPVIEDAAEALGSSYYGKPMGTFGTFGVYSFNGNKIITTSSGGALVSNDKEKISKAKFLSTQAKDDFPHYEHSEIGYNYRMSNICAAIGIGQLEVLKERVLKRRYNYEFYKKNLSRINHISFLEDTDGYYSNRWLTTIIIDKKSKINREDVRLELLKNNIESRPLWKPMHIQPIFKNYKSYENGVSEDLFCRGLCLPSGSIMSDNDLQRVVEVINKVFNEK